MNARLAIATIASTLVLSASLFAAVASASDIEIFDPNVDPPRPGLDITSKPDGPGPHDGPGDLTNGDDGPGPHDGPGDLTNGDDGPGPHDGPGDFTNGDGGGGGGGDHPGGNDTTPGSDVESLASAGNARANAATGRLPHTGAESWIVAILGGMFALIGVCTYRLAGRLER